MKSAIRRSGWGRWVLAIYLVGLPSWVSWRIREDRARVLEWWTVRLEERIATGVRTAFLAEQVRLEAAVVAQANAKTKRR